MFPFRNAWGDQLIHHPQFLEQTRRFMRVIQSVVDSLDYMRSHCAPRLIELGRMHVVIEGFLPDYFDVFTRAIIGVWRQELKEAYTADVSDAWKALFDFIIDHLKDGYNEEFRIKMQQK